MCGFSLSVSFLKRGQYFSLALTRTEYTGKFDLPDSGHYASLKSNFAFAFLAAMLVGWLCHLPISSSSLFPNHSRRWDICFFNCHLGEVLEIHLTSFQEKLLELQFWVELGPESYRVLKLIQKTYQENKDRICSWNTRSSETRPRCPVVSWFFLSFVPVVLPLQLNTSFMCGESGTSQSEIRQLGSMHSDRWHAKWYQELTRCCWEHLCSIKSVSHETFYPV